MHKSVLNSYLSVILGSIVFFYGGSVFIIGALREIKVKNPGMMTLITLAISSAYLYSIFITLSDLLRWSALSPRMSAFWWELTSLITIMLLGHYFEMKSVSSAQRALKEIEKLLPDQAEVINTKQHETETNQHEHKTKFISLHELKINDIVLVRPGGKIPADGIVIEGRSEVNESMITGESRPVLKEPGSEVIAGTINGDGILKIKVTKIGEETFLAGIKRLILEAQKSKSKLQVLADIFAKYLTFITIFVGSLSFTLWLLINKNISFALERLVTVLVISCPHALGLAIPLVVAISTSLAVHHGFLIRNRLQLELSRKIDIVLFDKTGTLTSGRFKVKSIFTNADIRELKDTQINADKSNYTQIHADRNTQIDADKDTQIDADKNTRSNDDTQIYADKNKEENLLYRDLTYKIRGILYKIYNQLGSNYRESTYVKAIEKELVESGIRYEKEKNIPIIYKGVIISYYKPDFVIEDKIILEVKSTPFIDKNFYKQVMSYLKSSSYKLALIANFGKRLRIKRIIYDKARQSNNNISVDPRKYRSATIRV